MVHCSMTGCNATNDKRLNRVRRNPDLESLHFYRFPRKNVYRKAWETVCARLGNFNTKNAYICSNHFKPDDYARNLKHELLNYCPKNSKKLKADAIPTVNIPNAIRLPDEIGNSILSALSISTSTLTPLPTKVIKPKIKVKSPQKLGIDTIQSQTGTGSADKLNTNMCQACGTESPNSNAIDNSSQYNGNDCLVFANAPTTSEVLPRKDSCNLELRGSDRWHKVPFAIDNSKQCNGDVCLAYFIPTGVTPIKSKVPLVRKSAWNVEAPGTKEWHKVQQQFLNHVIKVWVNRGRNGNPNIVMLDSMLRTRAKEAAMILDTFIFSLFGWLKSFKEKLRKEDARQPPKYDPNLCDLSMEIADIIEDEWLRYRREDDGILLDATELKDRTDEKPDRESYEEAFVPPSIVDWDSPIESYLEALDCLTMVENYALSMRNLKAVGSIADVEHLMRLECQ